MFWHLSHAPHRFLHVGVLLLRPLLAQHPSSEILERHPFLHQSAWSLGAGATDLFRLQFFESSWCSVWRWSSSLIMYIRRFERLKRFDLDLRWGSWSVQLLWLKPSPRSHLSFKRWVLWKFMDQIELNWLGFSSLSPWWQLRQIRTDKAPEKVIKSFWRESGSIEIGGVALHLCMCLGFNS